VHSAVIEINLFQ